MPRKRGRLLFFAFALAFSIKVPLFPFHTWLPDAHTEAPTAGSVILAAVLLKMGTYGLMRFNFTLFPEASREFAWIFIVLAVIGIIYGALVAMVQPDVKRLVAYSSVSHMGFVIWECFRLPRIGMQGAVYQMLNHGISTGALFLLVGFIYERRHTRQITDFGGLANVMPIYATIFVITTMSSIGLPFLNGFVGEFLIMLGMWKSHAALPAIGIRSPRCSPERASFSRRFICSGWCSAFSSARSRTRKIRRFPTLSWREIGLMRRCFS